jgi:hypothetical protein
MIWSLSSLLWSTTDLILCLSLKFRPTVSQPVSLGIKHPSGAYDQIFITVRELRVCWCGVLCLTRWPVCRLQLLPAQSFSGPSPVGLVIIFYCFRFVAFYESQGYGGGIRPRLHTGVDLILIWTASYTMYPYPRKRLVIPQRREGFQESTSVETPFIFVS